MTKNWKTPFRKENGAFAATINLTLTHNHTLPIAYRYAHTITEYHTHTPTPTPTRIVEGLSYPPPTPTPFPFHFSSVWGIIIINTCSSKLLLIKYNQCLYLADSAISYCTK